LCAKNCAFFDPSIGGTPWPYLRREHVSEQFQNVAHRLIHVKGQRRVGKTFIVKQSLPGALYLDFKQL